jgi:hypothetical protein
MTTPIHTGQVKIDTIIKIAGSITQIRKVEIDNLPRLGRGE